MRYAWRRLATRPTNEMCAQFIMFAMMYALRERFPDLRLCKKAHIERKQKSRRLILRDEDEPWLCLHTHTRKWLGKLPVAQRGHHCSYKGKEEGDSGIVMLDSLSLYSWLYIIFHFTCAICRGHQDDLSAVVMTIPHALGSRSFISWFPAQLPFPLVVHECRQLLLYFCCPSWLRLMFEAWRWGKSGSFPHPSLVCILFVFTLFLPETKKILKSCIISSQDKRLVVTMPCLIASRLPDICYRHDFFHDCLLSEL